MLLGYSSPIQMLYILTEHNVSGKNLMIGGESGSDLVWPPEVRSLLTQGTQQHLRADPATSDPTAQHCCDWGPHRHVPKAEQLATRTLPADRLFSAAHWCTGPKMAPGTETREEQALPLHALHSMNLLTWSTPALQPHQA